MQSKLVASEQTVRSYRELFVNRLAYTLQSSTPDARTGRHYYYRPKRNQQPLPLSLDAIRRHLQGDITIGLYAINPQTQCCKWVAIDADYENSIEDLLKLQWELKQDGIEVALEKSRRGGHLWLFADQPLRARDCRLYIGSLAKRLKVPIKGAGLADGIEVFPKQNELAANEFGNAMRGPLGMHRGAGKRFWFYGADYTLEAQMAYLARLKRITQEEMSGFVADLKIPEEFDPKPKTSGRPYVPASSSIRREFRILDYLTVKRKMGRNHWTRCPSCAEHGRDKSADNLAISIADPRKYKCWAGCTKEQIRSALGCPIRYRAAG